MNEVEHVPAPNTGSFVCGR